MRIGGLLFPAGQSQTQSMQTTLVYSQKKKESDEKKLVYLSPIRCINKIEKLSDRLYYTSPSTS